MALQVEMENDFGFTSSNCYVKIERFSGNSTGLDLDVLIYATPKAKADRLKPLKRERVHISYPKEAVRNIMEYCYKELKKQPSYIFSEDI